MRAFSIVSPALRIDTPHRPLPANFLPEVTLYDPVPVNRTSK